MENLDKNRVKLILESRVMFEPNTGCWLWTRSIMNTGYGQVTIDKKGYTTHRLSYMAYKGDVKGFYVCHSCDVRSCCNPDHLFLGTIQDNHRDMVRKKRHASGRSIGISKLRDEDINEILYLRGSGWTFDAIAKIFGVHLATIQRVCSRETWKHVPIKAIESEPHPLEEDRIHKAKETAMGERDDSLFQSFNIKF